VPFDITKAKEYLAASDYKGKPIKLVVTSGSFEEKLGQIIQGQLIAVGINIEVVPVDSGTRLTMASTGEGMDMYIQTSNSSLNDVSGIATQYRSSSTVPLKWEQTIQDKFDELLYAADTEMDSFKRQGYIAEILNIINDEALTIPLVSPVVAVAYNSSLQGVVPHFATWFPIKEWKW
jgi:ABC-type transport system substrate-binding protein